DGAYFPMLVCGGVELNQTPEAEQVIAGFKRMHARFPAFRLGYRLDIHADCWRKVPSSELDAHFQQFVQMGTDIDLDSAFAEAVRANNEPISIPIQAPLYKNPLTLRSHHSFTDGNCGLKLLAHLIIATFEPDGYERLPDMPMRYGLPIWRIAWDTP